MAQSLCLRGEAKFVVSVLSLAGASIKVAICIKRNVWKSGDRYIRWLLGAILMLGRDKQEDTEPDIGEQYKEKEMLEWV